MEIKLVRKHIIFKGRVQGVGFRYFCYTEANKMNLTGYVRNLYDGNQCNAYNTRYPNYYQNNRNHY